MFKIQSFYRVYYVTKKMQIKFLVFGAILYNFLSYKIIFAVIWYRDRTVWHWLLNFLNYTTIKSCCTHLARQISPPPSLVSHQSPPCPETPFSPPPGATVHVAVPAASVAVATAGPRPGWSRCRSRGWRIAGARWVAGPGSRTRLLRNRSYLQKHVL